MFLKQITNCMGYQQLATLTSAIGLTVPVTDKTGSVGTPKLAMIQCTGKDVRWTDDGTTPTATLGMVLVVGDSLMYDGDLRRIKFIETSATAVLNVSYYS